MPRLARQAASHRTAGSIPPKNQPRRVLRLWQVLERTGLSKSTLYLAISKGQFPAPVPILAGGKASGWLEAEVDAFLEGRFAARDQAAAG